MKFVKDEDMEVVGQVKRVLEWLSIDPEFAAKFDKEPEKMLEEIGVPLEPREVSFMPRNPDELSIHARFPGTAAEKYADFIDAKIEHREVIKKECAPDHKAMRKWRERQVGRCNMQLGARVVGIIQSVLTFELADGCSVGCEFCGLNAGRLKSVARYTEENAKLFHDIITYLKELLGDAAGHAALYFASEPLDNPDYELYNKDFVEVYGRIPQITTAAAMRHKDRLHKLIKELNANGETIYRFSVLSLDIFKQIMEEFTAEELTLVELLPQFDGAPSNHFAKVGREAEKEGGDYDNTISCISGFVINMARKEVRLTTPVPASKEHPTGEIILYKGNFEDFESFKDVINYCIKTYMSNILGPEEEFKLRDGVSFVKEGNKDIIECGKGVRYEMTMPDSKEQIDAYSMLFDVIGDSYMTRRQIVEQFTKKIESTIRPELLFYAINNLWKMGILETKSGKI